MTEEANEFDNEFAYSGSESDLDWEYYWTWYVSLIVHIYDIWKERLWIFKYLMQERSTDKIPLLPPPQIRSSQISPGLICREIGY